MSWVRRAAPPDDQHVCKPPMKTVRYKVPTGPSGISSSNIPAHPLSLVKVEPPDPQYITEQLPDGQWKDLWRCDGIVSWTSHTPVPGELQLPSDLEHGCGKLWQIVQWCYVCHTELYNPQNRHPGHMAAGLHWQPSTFWQRLNYPRRTIT